MYVRVAKRVRARDQISMKRNMVGIPYLGARNPHCPEYPLIYEILVGIPDQWGYRPVGIPFNAGFRVDNQFKVMKCRNVTFYEILFKVS